MYLANIPQVYASERNLKIISDEVWRIIVQLNDPAELFRNGDRIVWIERDDYGVPAMRSVGPDRLTHFLVQRIHFWTFDKKGEEIISARPPKDLVVDILARPDKSELPYLSRITTVPVFGPDGTLHDTPGYHPATHQYFAPKHLDKALAVEQDPPDYEIELARGIILEDLLGDFPFTGAAEKAHAVVAMLQFFIRLMIHGPTPVFLIEKPTPGTGGTLLAHVLCYPALGHFPSAVTQPGSESEWRYSLLSWLRDGPAVVLIDNLGDKLASPAFASAVTSTTFRERIIGSSDAVSVPIGCSWIATGNNPVLSTEFARRVARIRLDAKTEHPDLQRKFRQPDLRGWVVQNRPHLVWACLTLIQAWIAAGRPAGNISLGGFESWSEVLGGILKTVGIDGFLANRYDLRLVSDLESPSLRGFCDKWWSAFNQTPVGVAELWHLATDLALGAGGEHSQRIKFGKLLDSLRDRCFGDFRVEKLGLRQGVQQYRLQRVSGGS